MKTRKFDYTFEAILIVSGVIIAVFPQVIYTIFNIMGIAVILINVLKFIFGKLGKTPEYSVISFIFGVMTGLFITALPNMVEFGIPLALGICACFSAAERFRNAYLIKQYGKNFIPSLVLGIILAFCGVLFIINPFGTSAFIRRIFGIVLIFLGVMRIISSIKEKERRSNDIPDVIDGSFTSNGDYSKLK